MPIIKQLVVPITGREITTRRKKLNLTMAAAARKANTSYNTWSGWEHATGGRKPPGIVAACLSMWEKEAREAN